MGGLQGIAGLVNQQAQASPQQDEMHDAPPQQAQQTSQQQASNQPSQQAQNQQTDSLSQGLDAAAQHYAQQLQEASKPFGVKQMLSNFFAGMSHGMLPVTQTPQFQTQQALAGLQNVAQTKAHMATMQSVMAESAPVPLIGIDDKPVMGPNGPITLPANQARSIYAAREAGMYRNALGTAKLDAASPILTKEQASAIGHPELEGQEFSKAISGIVGQQAGKVQVTPDMVSKYNVPDEMVGKYVKMSDILSAERMTMSRTGIQWKETSPGVWQPLSTTSTRTFGKGGQSPSGAPSGGGTGGPRGAVYGGGPIYAYDPKTQDTVMTTPTEAHQLGYTNPRKVSQTNIENDRQLNNRLYDVAAKVTRYEKSLDTPISELDRAKIADLIGNDKLQFGAFGAHIPTDWLTKLTQGMSTAGLSPAAQTRLINYYNVREAMTGYTRVLTGSGRSNETNLQLNLQAMPDPVMPDNFTKQGIGQFKQNISIAGQGLPKMPGIQRAQDVLNPAPAVRFTEGADQYDIPADKIPAFKAKHPQAVPSGR